MNEKVARMRDPEVRAKILSEDRRSGTTAPAVPKLPFHRMFKLGNPPNYTPPKEQSIAAIAERAGRTPEDVAYDMLLEDDGQNFLYAPLANYGNYSLDAAAELLKHPNAIVGLSDGGAHVGLIMDGRWEQGLNRKGEVNENYRSKLMFFFFLFVSFGIASRPSC